MVSFIHNSQNLASNEVFRLGELPKELVLQIVSHLGALDTANLAVVFEMSNVLFSLRNEAGLWHRHTRLDPPAERPLAMQTCPQLPPSMASWQGQWSTIDPIAQRMVKAAPTSYDI